MLQNIGGFNITLDIYKDLLLDLILYTVYIRILDMSYIYIYKDLLLDLILENIQYI